MQRIAIKFPGANAARTGFLRCLVLAAVFCLCVPAGAFEVGDAVEVEWGGAWFEAEILERGQERCLVHYAGWDASYDEWVPDARIRYPQASADAVSGVSADFPVHAVGDSVEVRYEDGDWYLAQVLRAEGGRYYVHYSGYDASYDEWVGPERVRGLAVQEIRYRPADRYVYKVGDVVEVRSGGAGFSHTAKIVRVKNGQYQIRYDGYEAPEWTGPERIRLPDEGAVWDALMDRFYHDVSAAGTLGYFGIEKPPRSGARGVGPEAFAEAIAVHKRDTPFGRIDRHGVVSVRQHVLGKIAPQGQGLAARRDGKRVGTVGADGRIRAPGGGLLGRIDADGALYDPADRALGGIDPHTGYVLGYWGHADATETEGQRRRVAAFLFFFTELPHAMQQLVE